MAEERKDEGKLNLPPDPITPQVPTTKGSSLSGWRWSFMILFSLALISSLVSNIYYKMSDTNDTRSHNGGATVGKSSSNRSYLTCNECRECVERPVGSTRTRVSASETFPGESVRICHMGFSYEMFAERGGREVVMDFGPNNPNPFESGDINEFYLMSNMMGAKVLICKKRSCN